MNDRRMGRHPLLERLDVFIGEWTTVASFAPDDPVPAVFEWVLGGQFLMERSDSPDIPEAPDGISIVGLNPDGASYTQHYFDSRGVARLYAMTFQDGVWTLLRGAPDFTPLDFWQRFTGTFSADGRTVDGRWETSQDGETWERDFDLTYRRVT
jgi:hypothetical protein